MYGYTGKLLDVNLTGGEEINEIELSEDVLKKFYGGRGGLGTYLLWKELGEQWEKIDP